MRLEEKRPGPGARAGKMPARDRTGIRPRWRRQGRGHHRRDAHAALNSDLICEILPGEHEDFASPQLWSRPWPETSRSDASDGKLARNEAKSIRTRRFGRVRGLILDDNFLPSIVGLVELIQPIDVDALVGLAVFAEHVFDVKLPPVMRWSRVCLMPKRASTVG